MNLSTMNLPMVQMPLQTLIVSHNDRLTLN